MSAAHPNWGRNNVKPALAASRAVAVLNYVLLRSQADFSQKQLAEALGVNQTSMASVLAALTSSGYLVRHPRHRTFAVGPALVALGHAGKSRYPVVDEARAEMVRLAEHFGYGMLGLARYDFHEIILAVEGRPSPNRTSLIGQSFPLVPPFGQMFLPWSSRAEIDQWISLTTDDDDSHGRWRDLFSLIRARGYSVGLETTEVRAVESALVEMQRYPSSAELEGMTRPLRASGAQYAVGRIDADETYEVAYIAAPVFDATGTAVFSISFQDVGTVTGSRLDELGKHLASASRAVTRATGGHELSY